MLNASAKGKLNCLQQKLKSTLAAAGVLMTEAAQTQRFSVTQLKSPPSWRGTADLNHARLSILPTEKGSSQLTSVSQQPLFQHASFQLPPLHFSLDY